ncbi:MAG: PorV/PorQ family protein [Elusimicrobiota bacterium]|jgi:hypothetical protein|nr:PorV/PorQ family protein [Elusimicrobiota bacterium]
MRNITKYLLFAPFIFAAVFARAGDGGGAVAVPFLKMDMGARYYGMAGAATAFADDVTGMAFYNPAALGAVQSFQAAGTTYKNTLDMKNTHLGIAFPVGFLSFTGNQPLNAGFSFYMFDKGSIDDNGISRSVGDDIAFSLTLGENVATHAWDFMGDTSEVNHYLGASVKYIRSQLPAPGSGDVSGSAFAFDAGYRMTVDNHFGVGAALKNAGGKIKYISEADPLPTTVSVGAFLTAADVNGVRWDISGDYIYHVNESEGRIRLGTEAVFFKMLAARGGVKLMEELGAEYSLGFGLKLLGFEVDFGTILNPQLNEDRVYQAAVAYKFPVKKQGDRYEKDEKKRAEKQEQKQQQTQAAQQRAERNTNPILYQ